MPGPSWKELKRRIHAIMQAIGMMHFGKQVLVEILLAAAIVSVLVLIAVYSVHVEPFIYIGF
jgi:hypothetical protein